MQTQAKIFYSLEIVKQIVKEKKYMVSNILEIESPYSQVHSNSVGDQKFKSTALNKCVSTLCNISKRHISVRLVVRH